MSISADIHAAVLRKIDQNKRWIDLVPNLQEITIRIKYDRKTKQPRFVHLTVETEREVTETTS